MRSQIIHNDFNPDNILVSDEDGLNVSGIIDFGDMIQAPLINDLATAAAYQPIDNTDPLKNLADLAACYHKKLPLASIELDILFDLVRARQVMIVAITEWRAARQSSNRDYILRNNPRAWKCLEQFSAVPRAAAQQVLRRACNLV